MHQRTYFPNLNAVRFLAAFMVVIGHIEQFKGTFGLHNAQDTTFLPARFVMSGRDAVTLFFVLSGFLITYLLLKEHQQTGTVNIRKFYIRRALRIWPLYYLIILLSITVIPALYHWTSFEGYYISLSDRLPQKLGLYVLFLPNVADLLNLYLLGAMHLWTIGVEEQFYLLWPQLAKRLMPVFRRVLLLILAFKVLLIILNMVFGDALVQVLGFSYVFLLNFRVESMVIGGLGAWLLFHRPAWVQRWLHPRPVELAAIALILLNCVAWRSSGLLTDVLLSCVYIVFILNLAANPRSLMKWEHPLLHRLGNYSYGIYMYHPLIIYVLLVACSLLGVADATQPLFNPLFYLAAVTLTIGISGLSYHYFESFFLRLKTRATVVPSGAPDADVTPAPLPGKAVLPPAP
jgi:peptidoglycan/LPS O-acetylase OafA/YrhL